MRKREFRRPRGGRSTLSIDQLLSRQPKTIRRHPQYLLMLDHFLLSDSLKKVRMNRRCYRLLDRAVIEPENLRHFFKTYRLPQDPFFPLFFRIKRDYLSQREKSARDKEGYILKEMKIIPLAKRRIIRFLAEWEEHFNSLGERPLWETKLYPRTKKRVHELQSFGEGEWLNFFILHVERLQRHYPRIPESQVTGIKACLPLGLIPKLSPFRLPDRGSAQKAYRQHCRIYHPDSGGEAALFTLLQKSREILLDMIRKED
ncbi:hypothetical protein [Oceanispirochaeta sp.]|jgi:hypothetical protein|uniref:hypothetical protein n=1 Tax=Oceanispirochaeta sp. TaxID=2035350 RepID=UPI002633A026|nr:hypothetical protein [Oceanispirochaeta sp.]MDA3956857.1 hypothetical protein [Oceanispirochaeta sp.]